MQNAQKCHLEIPRSLAEGVNDWLEGQQLGEEMTKAGIPWHQNMSTAERRDLVRTTRRVQAIADQTKAMDEYTQEQQLRWIEQRNKDLEAELAKVQQEKATGEKPKAKQEVLIGQRLTSWGAGKYAALNVPAHDPKDIPEEVLQQLHRLRSRHRHDRDT